MVRYVIVQAGGKGTRLKRLTANKPKALLPLWGKPMLFHLFDRFPDARFIIIGDYKIDVLRRYLAAFATVSHDIVDGRGHAKTCAGLRDALRLVPDDTPFLYIWSDLVLPEDFTLPETDGHHIGISQGFRCRWKYEDGRISEEPSEDHGIAGFFLFQDKKVLEDVPQDGAFVRWLSGRDIPFRALPLAGVREFGLLEEYERLPTSHCRPFNSVDIGERTVVKKATNEFGARLAQREIAWYKAAREYGLSCIPRITSFQPLVMERVEGRHPFALPRDADKPAILRNIMHALAEIHEAATVPADAASIQEAYVDKTFARLDKVCECIPFFDEPEIRINGVSYPNPVHRRRALEQLVAAYRPERFCFIHGDCTFSNTLVRPDGSVVFIDPRGYYGHTELFGDVAYDYAKLYYSLAGNYDQFNRRRFRLLIGEKGVELEIDSNGWEAYDALFQSLLPEGVTMRQIRLLHGIIWLSLTTYAWDDYDSICGAFYNGVRCLAGAGL